MILYEDEATERKFKELDDQIRELWERIDLIEKTVDELSKRMSLVGLKSEVERLKKLQGKC